MPTKAERKELRRKKRAVRKSLRKERQTKFTAILAAVDKNKITIDLDESEPRFVEAFNQVWPILKPVLEYAEVVKITGAGADKVIRTVIDLGQRISTGTASQGEQTAFTGTLSTIWPPVKTVLGVVVTFTDDKVDKAINDIIEIGDWLTDEV